MTIEVVSNQIVDELGKIKVDFQKGVENCENNTKN